MVSCCRVLSGPDDFVHGLGEVTRGLSDALEIRVRLLRIAAGEFGEQRNLRQARADVVMDVLRDARAVAFDGVLVFHAGEFAAKFEHGHAADGEGHAAEHGDADEDEEPGGLVEIGFDGELDGGAGRVPNAVVITGDDVEFVITRRKETEVRGVRVLSPSGQPE